MRDACGPGTILGYGTNVHPGTTLPEIRANLARHATAVKRRVCPRDTMGIGLWLPAPAAATLRDPDTLASFRDWLLMAGLEVFTLNGFPHGAFHGRIVKHAVYRPDWRDPARLAYSIDLLTAIAGFRNAGEEGSVSTLPVAWGAVSEEDERLAAANLRAAAQAAARISAETGVLVHLDLEPEPGCRLDHAADVVRFFAQHLLAGPDADTCRRHLRVCHDVCHAAVMFEDQAAAFAAYDAAGIAVGKVQLSVAIEADLRSDGTRAGRRAALAAFAEPRYLHQTTCRSGGSPPQLYEDLPAALAAAGETTGGLWRVHFHVPVYLDRLPGGLATTQADLRACLDLVATRDDARHLEVETYAWSVLPEPLTAEILADGIGRELRWVVDTARGRTP